MFSLQNGTVIASLVCWHGMRVDGGHHVSIATVAAALVYYRDITAIARVCCRCIHCIIEETNLAWWQ